MAEFELGYNSVSVVAPQWGEWFRKRCPQILVAGITRMMMMMTMRMAKMAVPHQWPPSMEDPRLFPIEQAAAQQLRNIAKGTTDPGIEYYDLFECFNLVNNLYSKFIFINRNFCNIWGGRRREIHSCDILTNACNNFDQFMSHLWQIQAKNLTNPCDNFE